MKLRQVVVLLFALAAGSLLIPTLSIAGRWVGLQDFVALLGLGIYAFLLAHPNHPQEDRFFLVANFLFLLFITFFLFFSITNNAIYTGKPALPTELWQYAKRLAFLYIGFLAFTFAKRERFLYTIIITSLIAVLIGAVQLWAAGPLEFLVDIYGRTENQRDAILTKSLDTKRVYGVSGHSTSWGGICVFFIALSLPYVANPRILGSKFLRFSVILLLLLSSLNVLLSGSRGAMLAGASVYFTFFFFVVFSKNITRSKKITLLTFSIGPILFLAIYFRERLDFLIYRFSALIQAGGGARVEQIQQGISLLNNPFAILTGVGNSAQRKFAIGHGIEAEPIYLLVNYGVLGFSILYTILLIILARSFSLIKRSNGPDHQWALGIVGVCAILGYLVFSTGYFFYQELIVGAFPWLIFGAILSAQKLKYGKTDPHPS